MFQPSPYGLDPLEAAVLLAMHSRQLVYGSVPILRTSVVDYWVASRMRLDSWSLLLRKSESKQGTLQMSSRRPLVRMTQELFVSEILTRVWTSVTPMLPHPAQDEIELLSRSVFSGHLDVRRRVLTRLLDEHELGRQRARRLDSLRRRCERWTDMLLGCVGELGDVREFAFDSQRVADYHRTFFRTSVNARIAAESLYLCSLRQESGRVRTNAFPHHSLNQRIVCNLLGCFGNDLVDAVGGQSELWSHRIQQRATELQSLIGSLIAQ